jgi:hypothetical protein
MGLFDWWRRKKRPKRPVQVQSIEKPNNVEQQSEEVGDLIQQYESLLQRKEELQQARSELTKKLETGEIDPDDFRKDLMEIIQDGATNSEKLHDIGIKLTALGYKGVQH